MQPTGTVWTTLIGDHPGIIPVKFGQIPISCSRDVVWSFPYIIQCNKRAQRALGRSPERTTNVVHQILVVDLSIMLYTKYESSGPCSFFQKSSCLKLQGLELSYLVYSIIERSSTNIWWTTLVVLSGERPRALWALLFVCLPTKETCSLHAQIISWLKSQPCSNWQYSTQNQNLFPTAAISCTRYDNGWMCVIRNVSVKKHMVLITCICNTMR